MSDPEPCRVCKRPIEVHDAGSDDETRYCSEFCATVLAPEIVKFLTLKEGEFGVWPCSVCGCAVEDEYKVGSHCCSCEPKVRLKVRRELLERAAVVLREWATYSPSPSPVRDLSVLLDIESELERYKR